MTQHATTAGNQVESNISDMGNNVEDEIDGSGRREGSYGEQNCPTTPINWCQITPVLGLSLPVL